MSGSLLAQLLYGGLAVVQLAARDMDATTQPSPSSLSHCSRSVLEAIIWSVPLAFPFLSLMPRDSLPGSSLLWAQGAKGSTAEMPPGSPLFSSSSWDLPGSPEVALPSPLAPSPCSILLGPPLLPSTQPPLSPAHVGHVQAWAPCVLGTLRSWAATCGSSRGC